MTRTFRYLVVVGGAIIGILLFLLASASEKSSFFEQNYAWLLGLNALVAAALLALVVLLLARLYRRYRKCKFGSRLMARLVLLFALIGILPGALIYLVSVQFVSRSIESWFDVRVEAALESGLNLGRAALDASLSDLQGKGRSIAQELADLTETAQARRLSRLQDQMQMQEASILTANGRVITSTGEQLGSLLPDLPSSAILRQARMSSGFSAIEGEIEPQEAGAATAASAASGASAASPASSGLRLRVVVLIPPSSNLRTLQNETHFLQLLQPVPTQLASNAEALRAAYSEY